MEYYYFIAREEPIVAALPFLLPQMSGGIPKLRAQSLRDLRDIIIEQVRSLLERQMHASVWVSVGEGVASPCLADCVPAKPARSIFPSDADALKACSTRSSKLRVVWVCTRDAYATATRIA